MSTFYRDDEFDLLNEHAQRLQILESGCPPYYEPLDSELKNGWTQAFESDPQWEPWGYRICDGQLEFKGHLLPGTLGTAAYTLPLNYRINNGNLSWPSHMVMGTTFTIVHIKVNVITGDVFIYPNF